jgi:geranylgeranyl pyrophosphate synthase
MRRGTTPAAGAAAIAVQCNAVELAAFGWRAARNDVVFLFARLSGKATVNSLYGSKVAVLVGDFLFAQSSWFLANLDNLEVRVPESLAHLS